MSLSGVESPTNEVILSVASVWEVAVKHALHKLPLPASPPALVDVSVRRFALKLLPISVDHALAAANLPGHHKDPFDRMLIAQAVVEDLTFATADGRIRMYEVARLWAT